MGLILQGLLKPSTTKRDLYLVAGASAAATLMLITLAKLSLQSTPPSKVTRSPRKDVETLSKEEAADLPYPPDVFPGARDVESSYGSMRVYEWGPEEGRKVLLLHGITTPCIALGSVANALVEKGCRVMLFDLFGRGYSDSPSDLPHDARLYTTQILLALNSSTLHWTGEEGFSVVGYSLGGGIAAEFVSYFDGKVRDLVLLAPSGLIRSHHFGWASRAVYSPLIPTWFVNWIVGRRLQGASSSSSCSTSTSKTDLNEKEERGGEQSEKVETAQIVHAEIKGNRDPAFESAILSYKRPHITVANAVQWQVENHTGFVNSFVSSIRYAPIERQFETWKRLKERKRKVLVIAGKNDVVIRCEELREDVLGLVGEEGVVWREVDGGHEFPIVMGAEVVRIIGEVWESW